MSKYRTSLPQMKGDLLMTDGGLETTLVFHEGYDLPCFAAFVLLEDEKGRTVLRDYFRTYMDIARRLGIGIVLETVTWRSNPGWSAEIGYSPEAMDEVNRESVKMLEEMRAEFEPETGKELVISGCVGPRGDGYVAGTAMNVEEAKEYHSRQINVFADAGADLVTAITMTYPNEAIGVANAAAEAETPCVISFTVETDGRLPDGTTLAEAIGRVDAEADAKPAYYMINCAHPSHFSNVLEEEGEWKERVRGTRVNASKMSHEELDNSEVLDEGDPAELASDHAPLIANLPNLRVVGGCCGTDHRHVEEIARAFSQRSSAGAN